MTSAGSPLWPSYDSNRRLQWETPYDSNQIPMAGILNSNARLRRPESPWVSWRLGCLDLRGDDDLALTMVVEAVDPPEQVPLRGVTGLR